ncbi:ABC transporter substrate-binding protein [uncultured Desulfobacter sp.]|uniref:ABC transporter substrate-binding protein n=1 Tax=uncultured Desulfobacter sp. TaxID=240139 RepID=UPI0029F54ADD|nr:ABC transporter substrate-binding protein [uncultured Desulfobacter sp.]
MKTFISAFFFTVVSFYCQPAMAEHFPLTISTSWGAMDAAVIIAQEKGFFKEQRIKATTTAMSIRGTRGFQAYVQGKADATCTTSLHIVRSNFDPSLHVIIGTLSYTDNQMKLLAKKSAGITRVSDLKGKKIAVPRAGFAHFYLEKFLLFNGLTLNDVEAVFVSKKKIPGSIESGLAHATMQHGVPIAETKKILGKDYVIFQNPAIHRKSQHFLVPRKWVAQHREQAKGLLRAILKGEEFIKTHTEESIEILAKAKKYDIRDMAHTVLHEMDYYLSLKQSIFTNLEGIEQWALDNNIVERKTPRNYFEMIDYSLLEEIDPKRVTIIR